MKRTVLAFHMGIEHEVCGPEWGLEIVMCAWCRPPSHQTKRKSILPQEIINDAKAREVLGLQEKARAETKTHYHCKVGPRGASWGLLGLSWGLLGGLLGASNQSTFL